MIIVMKGNSTAAEIGAVIAKVQEAGAVPHPIYGIERTVVAVVGETRSVNPKTFMQMPGVEGITSISICRSAAPNPSVWHGWVPWSICCLQWSRSASDLAHARKH